MATLLYTSSFVIFAFANSWEMLAVAYAYQQVVLFYMPAMNAILRPFRSASGPDTKRLTSATNENVPITKPTVWSDPPRS